MDPKRGMPTCESRFLASIKSFGLTTSFLTTNTTPSDFSANTTASVTDNTGGVSMITTSYSSRTYSKIVGNLLESTISDAVSYTHLRAHET